MFGHVDNIKIRYFAFFTSISAISAVAGAATASYIANPSQNERVRVEHILVQNPDILKQAIVALNAREEMIADDQSAKFISENADKIFRSSTGRIADNAKNSIVEFVDYNCSACKAINSQSQKRLSKYNVIIRQAPILGGSSELAAQGAVYAEINGTLPTYHNELMATQGRVTESDIARALKLCGLSYSKFIEQKNSSIIVNALKSDENIRTQMDIVGTPSYVTTKTIVQGYDIDKILSNI